MLRMQLSGYSIKVRNAFQAYIQEAQRDGRARSTTTVQTYDMELDRETTEEEIEY